MSKTINLFAISSVFLASCDLLDSPATSMGEVSQKWGQEIESGDFV